MGWCWDSRSSVEAAVKQLGVTKQVSYWENVRISQIGDVLLIFVFLRIRRNAISHGGNGKLPVIASVSGVPEVVITY